MFNFTAVENFLGSPPLYGRLHCWESGGHPRKVILLMYEACYGQSLVVEEEELLPTILVVQERLHCTVGDQCLG